MKLGLTFFRALVGALFIGHGTQKLFGWFGGHGLEGTGQFFEQLGFRPGKRHAALAGAAEAGGGALLAAGFLTPRRRRGHHRHDGPGHPLGPRLQGPVGRRRRLEYNAVLIATVIALTEVGPGPVSLDNAFGIERKGTAWALAALAAGAAGPFLTDRFLNEEAPVEQAPAETVREHGEVDASAPATA